MMKKIMVVVAVMFMAMLAVVANAEEFGTAFQKTVSEMPDGADAMAIGGATTAVPDFSSKNPALLAVKVSEKPIRGSVFANYGFIKFNNGPNTSMASLSATAKLPVGVLQVVGNCAGSNTGELGDFDSIKINSSPSIGIQYGLQVPALKDLYVGASYTYSQSRITARTTFVDPLDTEIISKSKSHEVGVGGLYQPSFFDKKVSVGIFFAHSWDEEKSYIDNLYEEMARSQTDQIRFGVSAKVTSMTMISAEIRHYWLPDGATSLQYFIGVEQYIVKDFFAIYGGCANGGVAGGAGVYFENGGVNLAYMYRPFRATEDFLGKAQMTMLSAYYTF